VTGRVVRLARGVSSLVAVVVLAVGVPVLLARIVGWPLPTKLPTVDEVSLATRSGIADSTIAKTIAVVAWIAWLQVAAALVAETAAVLKGRSAVRLPVLPGVQVFAASNTTGTRGAHPLHHRPRRHRRSNRPGVLGPGGADR
jgi:hypothetical protein